MIADRLLNEVEEMDRQEELVVRATENLIRTMSGYNTHRARHAKMVASGTFSEIQTAPSVPVFKIPEVPKITKKSTHIENSINILKIHKI